MKIHAKKKHYKAQCRAQVVKGLINSAEGNWISAPSLGGKSIDIFAGYRIGNSSKKRRGPKSIKPEVE